MIMIEKTSAFMYILITATLLALLMVLFTNMTISDEPGEVTIHNVILGRSTGNERFLHPTGLAYNYMLLSPEYIQLNTTRFNITTPQYTNITLSYLVDNVSNVTDHDDIVNFTVDSSWNEYTGYITYNISNFATNEAYLLLINSVFEEGFATSNGTLIFSENLCWNKVFLLKRAEAYDIVPDTTINASDVDSMEQYYGVNQSIRQDINGDGVVNYIDIAILSLHYGDDYL